MNKTNQVKQDKNWAIFGLGLSMDSIFIRNLLNGNAIEPFQDLNGKRGVLFSNFTLNQFIKEEVIHDDYKLSRKNHRSIRTFSSGEQKKALLDYLLSKNPDFIVLENVFDMLDQNSHLHLLARLESLSKKIRIIQIFRRKENMLPFINHVLSFQDGKILFSGTKEAYEDQFAKRIPFSMKGSIPSALVEFDTMDNPLIKFNNVSIKYGKSSILKDIHWKIKKGEFWHLKGPNGSGKTTLLTMITGDNPKAYGQDLTIFGRKKGTGESVWDIKAKIGYVTPAMTVLFRGKHTVENMIISGLYDSIGLYKWPGSMERKLANRWIELLDLTHLKDKWFSFISEQQQCMVLIARAMIKHPPLLILDEPSHGLDDDHSIVLTQLINKIASESQTAIIYVSHKKEEGLNPRLTFELTPEKGGSKGEVQNHFE